MFNWATIFSGNQQPNAQQQAPQNPQPAPSPTQPAQPAQTPQSASTTDPKNSPAPTIAALDKSNISDPTQQPATQSPLDKFVDVFKIEDNKDASDPNAKPLFNVDKDQLAKAIQGMDFIPRGDATKELLAKIQAGDTDALVKFINHSNQNVYSQQVQFVQNIAEKLMSVMQERMQTQVPSMVKKFSTNDLINNNPKYNHAALAPLVTALSDQFSMKYPNASPQEINAKVSEYMDTVASNLLQPTESQIKESQKASATPDWTDFFSGTGNS